MRDRNDNNIDDNLEAFGLIAGLQHLQNQADQKQELARIRQQLRNQPNLKANLEQIEVELKATREAQEAERLKEQSLPQCPICGGRLPGQFKKCKHCQSDLSWVERIPCEPAKEGEIREQLRQAAEEKRQQLLQAAEAERQKQVEQARAKREQEERQIRDRIEASACLPDACPKCNQSFERFDSRFGSAIGWDHIASFRNEGFCHGCSKRKSEFDRQARDAAAEKSRADQLEKSRAEWVVARNASMLRFRVAGAVIGFASLFFFSALDGVGVVSVLIGLFGATVGWFAGHRVVDWYGYW